MHVLRPERVGGMNQNIQLERVGIMGRVLEDGNSGFTFVLWDLIRLGVVIYIRIIKFNREIREHVKHHEYKSPGADTKHL